MRRCKLGGLCWLATVSRLEICARLARIASRKNSLCGSDVYRINDLVKTAKLWQKAAVLIYASSSQLGTVRNSPEGAKMRQREEEIHSGAMTLAGWSNAALWDQSSLGKCRRGYVIGLMSSALSGPCHISHWASEFARIMVTSSLGGEVFAFSEMLRHMPMLREFYGHYSNLSLRVWRALRIARVFSRTSEARRWSRRSFWFDTSWLPTNLLN